jgi:hypothetical protein
VILQSRGESLLLITQPDHAALARQIMDHWKADGLPESPRRASIVHAIDQHDNGWLELDTAPMVDPLTGTIADFMHAPADLRQGVWPRGVQRLAGDAWAAALVAQHAIHIYSRYADDLEWWPFFEVMARLRREHAGSAGVSTEGDEDADPLELLEADYLFLRVGDLISLTFCNAWTEPHQHEQYTIAAVPDGVLVTPDPFNGARIAISIRARQLPNRPYRDNHDARDAWNAAREITLTGSVAGSNPGS